MTRALVPTSLIISTYNWEAALELVLRSVLRQSRLPAEVLIADDGSGSPTAELIAQYVARLPIPLQHVWQEDRGFRKTSILNRALAVARGPYVIMLDGDMVLHPQFIQSHVAFARQGWYVQGGRVLLREAATQRMLAGKIRRVWPWTLGIDNRINTVSSTLLARVYRGPQGSFRGTRGGNMGYWLADAQRINGYNEDCVGWGAEDVEFAARLQNAGVRRRNLKFGGIAYHLHHRTRPRESEPANLDVYNRAVRDKSTRCESGLDKYTGTVAEQARGAPYG
jgi:glycosyltransferase involved in cell wall biosynthesis